MSDDEMEGARAGRGAVARAVSPHEKARNSLPPPSACSPPDRHSHITPPPSTHAHTDYGFAYSDDEVAEEDADIENAYYSAKGALEDGGGGPDAVRAALAGFQEVLAMEQGARGDWGFKAL